MKHPLHFSLIAGLGLASLHGQSADSLATQPTPDLQAAPPLESETAPVEAQAEQTESTKTNPELVNEPSRYVGIDMDSYIHAVSSTFSMRNREQDPFGRYQDPNYKPKLPVAPRTRGPKKYTPPPVTPFVDIVGAIQITTIIPGQQRFLVGDRSFRVGDAMSLRTNDGKLLKVYVVAVDSDRVKFRHGVTQETAEQALKMLPGGMQRGGGGSRPPGVIAPDEQAPIDLSGSATGNSLSSSR